MYNDVKFIDSQSHAHKMRRDNGNESNESDDINKYYAQTNPGQINGAQTHFVQMLSVRNVDLY